MSKTISLDVGMSSKMLRSHGMAINLSIKSMKEQEPFTYPKWYLSILGIRWDLAFPDHSRQIGLR